MHRTLAAVIVILLLAGVFFWYFYQANPETEQTSNDGASSASGMRIEENMVVITEQRPGNVVVASQIHIASPGFVVIHEDKNGLPGAILGSSPILQAGDSQQVTIKLSRAVRDGERLHAMLHNDTDASGTFGAPPDAPVRSRLGSPIEGWFEVSSQAPENVFISY